MVIRDIPGNEVLELVLYAAPEKQSAITYGQSVASVHLSESSARMTTSLKKTIPRKRRL